MGLINICIHFVKKWNFLNEIETYDKRYDNGTYTQVDKHTSYYHRAYRLSKLYPILIGSVYIWHYIWLVQTTSCMPHVFKLADMGWEIKFTNNSHYSKGNINGLDEARCDIHADFWLSIYDNFCINCNCTYNAYSERWLGFGSFYEFLIIELAHHHVHI